MTIGSRIKAAREARKISASELARRLDVSPAAVWHWENDKTHPRPESLSALESVLRTRLAAPSSASPAPLATKPSAALSSQQKLAEKVREIIRQAELDIAELTFPPSKVELEVRINDNVFDLSHLG